MNPLLTSICMSTHHFMPILHLVDWVPKTIIDLMEDHTSMQYFICLGKENILDIWGNHTQQWCGMGNELNVHHLFHFIQEFLCYNIHVHIKSYVCGGLQVWWPYVHIWLFSNINGQGAILCHQPTHINNPWVFYAICFGFLIIKLIIIKVQVCRVHKHCFKTTTINSIPSFKIMNNHF